MNDSIFQRAELLLGTQMMERIARQRVIIFGVGGVGSWCAEGLVRSGIRQLTIVDNDCVCLSNVNRQLMATTKTVGRPKVEALREHLLEINPEAQITPLQMTYSADSAAGFQLETYDYIIDAIDSLEHKCNLILHATSLDARFFSSMGAGRSFPGGSFNAYLARNTCRTSSPTKPTERFCTLRAHSASSCRALSFRIFCTEHSLQRQVVAEASGIGRTPEGAPRAALFVEQEGVLQRSCPAIPDIPE